MIREDLFLGLQATGTDLRMDSTLSDRGPLAGGWKLLRADFIDALSSLSIGPVRGIEADPAGPEEGLAADRPNRALSPCH